MKIYQNKKKKYFTTCIMAMMFCLTLLVVFKQDALADGEGTRTPYAGSVKTPLVFEKVWEEDDGADERPETATFNVLLSDPTWGKEATERPTSAEIEIKAEDNWRYEDGKRTYYMSGYTYQGYFGYYFNSATENEIDGYTYIGEEVVYLCNGIEYDGTYNPYFDAYNSFDTSGDVTCIVRLINVKNGDLVITKEVIGTEVDANKEFHFTITLQNDRLDGEINGTYGDATFVDGVAAVTLKHGETVAISDIPGGTTYTVTENEANQDGYTTTSTNETGTIPKGGSVTAAFTNRKDGETEIPTNPDETEIPTNPDETEIPTNPDETEKPEDSKNSTAPKTGDIANVKGTTILFMLASVLLVVGFMKKRI